MSWLEALAVVAAGIGAGTINTVVGSGSLITFPTLLAVGYPPVLANVSNCVGLVAGGVSGTLGYRRELAGQSRRLVVLGAASATGAVVGAALLLVLPAAVFSAVVPVLVLLGCVLVVAQPRLVGWLGTHRHGRQRVGPVTWTLVCLTGVYGGYFGAAQGVLLVALLGLALDETLQRVNAAKNVLSLVVNSVAGAYFVASTEVAWAAAGLLAVGSLVGGRLGATVGRRLPDPLLRAVIVGVGITAAVLLLR